MEKGKSPLDASAARDTKTSRETLFNNLNLEVEVFRYKSPELRKKGKVHRNELTSISIRKLKKKNKQKKRVS